MRRPYQRAQTLDWTCLTSGRLPDVPENTKRLLVTAASLAIVLLIAWLDQVTPREIGFALFYLVPIALSAWYGGVGPAVVVATLAGASWLVADLGGRPDGSAVAISLWNAFTRCVIFVSEGVFIAILRRDREKLRELALRESILARTDLNTGLANARAFLEHAESELKNGRPLAILYIDLDNFKAFNDRLGHAAGDDILLEVARVLRESVNEEDLVARIGGDEFAVLLCCEAGEAEARRVGDMLVERIREIASVYGDIRFGATVGIAMYREPPSSAEEFLRSADEAMYRGKALGKGRVVLQNV